MKKILVLLLALVSLSAFAEGEFRWLPNDAGGKIYLTLTNCSYPGTTTVDPNSFYFYTTNQGGRKLAAGCYTYSVPFYYATYYDGSQYTWNAAYSFPVVKPKGFK